MAKSYRVGPATRAINAVFRGLTRLGIGASYRWILTVPGRKTGRMHSTPVDVMEVDGARWLVAPYGPTNWVLNARAAGRVTLRRGNRSEVYDVREAIASEAVPVLRTYMTEVRITRPYFDAGPDAPDSAVAAELLRHPTFRLTPVAALRTHAPQAGPAMSVIARKTASGSAGTQTVAALIPASGRGR